MICHFVAIKKITKFTHFWRKFCYPEILLVYIFRHLDGLELVMVAAGSGIWTTFSVSRVSHARGSFELCWTCARLPLQGTDWACCAQLHSASRPLPLLLLPHPPRLSCPLYITTDWAGGRVAAYEGWQPLSSPVRSRYSTTGLSHRPQALVHRYTTRAGQVQLNYRPALCLR